MNISGREEFIVLPGAAFSVAQQRSVLTNCFRMLSGNLPHCHFHLNKQKAYFFRPHLALVSNFSFRLASYH